MMNFQRYCGQLAQKMMLKITLMMLTVVMLSLSCAQPFRVASRSTLNFPHTWEELSKGLRNPIQTQASSPRTVTKAAPLPKKSIPKKAPARRDPPQFKGETERIAVLELLNKAPQQVSPEEVAYLTNELRTVASYLPTPRFLVLTKESLESLIDPEKTLEECVGSCEIETGRMVGARWILTGSVVKFGKSLRVSLKIHDTSEGHFLKGAVVKGKSVEELEEGLHTQALSLIKEVSPEWKRWIESVAPDDSKAQLKHLRSVTY